MDAKTDGVDTYTFTHTRELKIATISLFAADDVCYQAGGSYLKADKLR